MQTNKSLKEAHDTMLDMDGSERLRTLQNQIEKLTSELADAKARSALHEQAVRNREQEPTINSISYTTSTERNPQHLL